MKPDALLYAFAGIQTSLVALKVMNVINWSWLYVLIPLWLIILFSFIGVALAILHITKKDNGDWYEGEK